MTNKTEMVSDAELDELEVAEVLLAQQGFSNLAHAISAAYTFIKETRAAPAEDVRAVVEEPVRVAIERHISQRSVVLPERRKSDGWLDITSQDRGWNACLDAVEELNK